MASLREIAREYKDEIMSGIAWVAIWKTGRSWNARVFWLNSDAEKIECEEMEEARAIVAADENAIFINEYYTAHMGEGKLDEIMDGIRYMYEEGYNLLKDSAAYDETEDQEEPEGPADTWTAKVISLAEDPEGNQEECTEFIQKNEQYQAHSDLGVPFGFGIFWEKIVPKLMEITKSVGCKYIYLFAADKSDEFGDGNIKSLVNYYKNDFKFYECEDDDLVIVKPDYDEDCYGLIQEVSMLEHNREAVWHEFSDV